MATALQQQLAAINARSTDQLNLKAQKTRHSQSILFEPREAAGQSFDTIFQLCQEGFAELCQLDRRYVAFSRNLFAESSLNAEREQMTAAENKELNIILTQFLGLISGKLLLRPAQKCLEWLIRRWRAHEHNTSTLLYAVLPYHGHDLFATILSILPKQLPTNFSYLRPYVASLQCPPRHAIVSAAVSNDSFISSFNTFVLETSKRRLQSTILVGSWISILAQSLNIRLDGAQSGRDDVRRQRSEDVLLKTLPVLQDLLAISGAPDLYLAACMLMTILATKIDLEDKVLDAFMDSLVDGWTIETVQEGVECLALLAEEKNDITITKKVYRAIIKNNEALHAMLSVGDEVRTDNLVASFLDCGVRSTKSSLSTETTAGIVHFLEHVASYKSFSPLLRTRLLQIKSSPGFSTNTEIQSLLEDVVDHDLNGQDVEMEDDRELLPVVDNTGAQRGIAVLETIKALPSTTSSPSFLANTPEADSLYAKYLDCFTQCCVSEESIASFLQAQPLHTKSPDTNLQVLSFLARCWTSARHPNIKKHALASAKGLLAGNNSLQKKDLQALFPYVLTALTDASGHVRRAAAELWLAIPSGQSGMIWAKTSLYHAESEAKTWLTPASSARSLVELVESRLQECILDQTVIKTTLVAHLNDKKADLAQRAALSSFLLSHALLTPVQEVQSTLLDLFPDVGRAATEARTTSVVQYIKAHAAEASASHRVHAAIQCLGHTSEIEIQALQDVAETVGSVAYQKLGKIFARAKPDLQITIIDWLCAKALPEDDSDPDGDAAHTLRTIRLPIGILVHMLSAISNKASGAERPAKRQRLGRLSQDNNNALDTTSLDAALRRASTFLEIVEDSLSENKPTTDDQPYTQLVKLLFSMLGDIQSWRASTGSELTYLQVLTLNNILATLRYSNATSIDRSVLRTDMVVETLRSTASPQVHNSALLVISKIATFAPDTVLHSVMPLFTFMSSSTLRQADAYSVHVINMTIESIVPPLRESLKAKGKDLVAGASDLLLSFTAAFEHVPGHRRQDTFVQLLKVLGPNESLYAVLAMLVERYSEDSTLLETLRSIMRAFSVQIQLNALVKYLDLVGDACKKRRGLSDSILGFLEKNAAEANASVAVLLDGWANLILSTGLQNKVASELRKDGAQTIQDIYSTLLEKLVSLPYSSTTAVKFDEPTLKSAQDAALQALLELLPTEEFITSSATLMQAGSEQVRVKVFISLTNRVNAARNGDARLAEIFIDCLPNCAAFLAASQPVSVRKAAIDCVDAISEKFGKRDRQAVGDVVKVVMGPAALASDNSLLQTASLLCLASSVEVLGEEFVSIAKPILEAALDLASATTSTTTVDTRLVDAVFTLINSVLDHEAWLLDAVLLGRAIVLACKVKSLGLASTSVDQFCMLAPQALSLKELCSALNATFQDVNELGAEAVLARVKILQAAITNNTKTTVTKNADSLTHLVLQLFDLRPSPNDEEDTMSAAYDVVLASALDMTLKLNDLTFRPLFTKVVSWADNESANKTRRQIVLFEFAQRLFDQLGSIITAYASYLLDDVSTILGGSRADDDWPHLVKTVLQALSANFKTDQDDFWTAPQHFDAVVDAVLDLLVQPVADIGDVINSTIEELAAAVSASPDRLKAMNTKIMVALRHENASVRLAAVNCERQITARLTFDWLNLLPEMLPYISELLEDDDEAVERAVLLWVKQIEDVTGESLEGMLA